MIALILFFIIIISGFNVKVNSNFFSLIGKVIIIDPGHGGKDPGTLYKDIYEKDINLNIALILEKELIKEGASVILTRNADYDLSTPNARYRKKSDFDNRINIINESNADLYLSIHLNYLNQSEYHGGQVFFDKNNLDIAQSIQKIFNEELNNKREIKNIPKNNYMYEKLKISGVLIECGFLSNFNERKKLQTIEYQKNIAKIITKGIVNYYNGI